MFHFLFLTLSLAIRGNILFILILMCLERFSKKIGSKRSKQLNIFMSSITFAEIGVKRLVPSGPNNETSPISPPDSIVNFGIKRLVPSGPNNETSSHSIVNFGAKRLIPSGLNDETSSPSLSHSKSFLKIN